MNPTDAVQTQPTDLAPATPSSTTDWEAEYKKIKRQYDGREGYIKTLTKDKEDATHQATQLSTDFEKFKNESYNPIASQFDQIKAAKEQLEGTVGQTKAELETLRLVSTEFPDLAKYVAKGMINPNGKQGDELRQFLTDWKTEFESLGVQNTQQRNAGSAPPPPATTPQGEMTFDEVATKKLEALRKYGARSKEFQELSAMENRMMAEGKFSMGTDVQQVSNFPSSLAQLTQK